VTTEPVARVVADLRAGRTRTPTEVLRHGASVDTLAKYLAAQDATVVDATTIYRRLVEQTRPVWLYDDHPCIAPPFQRFDVCYENEHGNVIVMTALAKDYRGDPALLADTQATTEDARPLSQPEGWESAEPVDWSRVRWTVDTFCWVGARGAAGPVATTGPLHLWRFAIYEDGAPADLHWIKLMDRPMEEWDMAHLVLLGALNFLACRNVVLVEAPGRNRAERRRLGRIGVGVHEIAVLPSGKTRKGIVAAPGEPVGSPLASVRGNFAEYGTNGKGLLFGKLSGRFWRPGHAVGDPALGERRGNYRLEGADR
jgi:hypothetical protein